MYDLVVLGGGAGGIPVARAAARVGAKVALIDKAKPGTAGAHNAAVMSKALVRASRIAHELKGANAYGIRPASVEIDFTAVMARVRSVAARLAADDAPDCL